MEANKTKQIQDAIDELRSELARAKANEEKKRIRAKLIRYGKALSRLENLELDLWSLETEGYLAGVKKLLKLVSKYNRSKFMKVRIIEDSIRIKKQSIKVDLEVILLDEYIYKLTATISSPF